MRRIAKFEKVSLEQFMDDIFKLFPDLARTDETVRLITEIHSEIKLPQRADSGSAGYDFYSTIGAQIEPNGTVTIPTGIRCKMKNDWVLLLNPRSSLGFKYRIGLANTTGVIDASYYNANNEGHIMAKIVNNGSETFSLTEGDRFIQGLFVPYGITSDDKTKGKRIGGIGSSGK